MVREMRDRGLWATLGTLTVLLAVLAVLQYRWTSEIGRAEAERRQTQLERSAWRFDAAFDRELAHLGWAFRLDPHVSRPDRRSLLVERLAAWRRNEHAGLLAGLLLVTRRESDGLILERCAAGEDAFHAVEWTGQLEPLRARLEASGSGRSAFLVRPGLLLDPPLAVPFPLVDAPEGPGDATRWGPFQLEGLVLLELDPAYLREQLLPQLAEAHFGPLAESEFAVAVVRKSDSSVVYASDEAGDAAAAAPADVQRTLGGRGGRPNTSARGPRASDEPGREPKPPVDDEGPWLLLARHRGGSLEQRVATVRRRNLVIGFGVLGLLGGTAVVLATSAQRARRLARQQMEFVAGVTHELNTPLAAIRSAGQNLSDGIVTAPDQVRRYGSLIEKEGGRLTALVAQVLDFAGIDAGSRAYASEPVSVASVVDDVLRDHRLVLDQAGMEVERDLAPDLPAVAGDAAALRRALANVVANTTKFASAGRWLAVRASRSSDRQRVVVRVEDRGPGIPRDERERVFEPFYRGAAAERNATPGAGLGLSLVRHVVRAHRGRVRVELREGGGTAVVIELPVADDGP